MIHEQKTIESELMEITYMDNASEFQPVDPARIITAHWVRQKCQFGCPNYGTRLSCPPYSPGPEETRKVLDEYSRAYLIGYDGFLYLQAHRREQDGDWWTDFGNLVRQSMLKLERHAFLAGYYRALAYGFGGCKRCEICALAEGKHTCKFPAEIRTSMEAAGIDVYGTIRNAGLELSVLSEKGITGKGQMVLHVLLLLE